MTDSLPPLDHLDWLEAEALHVLREVAGQCANPVLLFSGGKDSICLLRLAEKAFRPSRFPFPLLRTGAALHAAATKMFLDKDRSAVNIVIEVFATGMLHPLA